MSDLHTEVPVAVPLETDDDSNSDLLLSPEEAAWWRRPRDVAYQALTFGAKPVRLARELGVSYQTLHNWRHHPYWQARAAREGEARARAHAAALFGVDEAAVASLRTHVETSPHVALRYALARGLLAHGLEDREEWWVYAAREARDQP